MDFIQTAPKLPGPFSSDATLQRYLARVLPGDVLRAATPELEAVAELAKGELYDLYLADPRAEPRLVSWSPWGERQDHIELPALWRRSSEIAATHGIVGTAYERAYGSASRIVQMALAYLYAPSAGTFACPLAMTDGAAATLLRSGNQRLVERAVSRLTSRSPLAAWTSGQWMTERTGGSDVAISESIARPNDDGTFGLYGTKWFTSATTSEMALTLARPVGNPPGGSGLALFYVETRRADGSMNGIRIHRLKDKLGTRMLPTAELALEGTVAIPVYGTRDGIKNIAPMLNVTRTWNSVVAAAGMRRAVSLSCAYARERVAFGAPLSEKPLHRDTLAGLEAETMGAFHLAFRVVALIGKEECGEATDEEVALLRLLTPIVKLTTGKQAVAVASEALEAFGGAGYVEDTGLPALLRDAQVLPIWEGTTNVLSLDLARALAKTGTMDLLMNETLRATEGAPPACHAAAETAKRTVKRALDRFVQGLAEKNPAALEGDARRFAMTLGRALEVALLVEQEAFDATSGFPGRAAAAANRLCHHGIDLLDTAGSDPEASAAALLDGAFVTS
ncbi:MAG: acyl-CoA dehydrogenase family protein [Polyangiaceae bacterium]